MTEEGSPAPLRFLDSLPDSLARPIRVAWVPPDVRALFEHLPEHIALDVRLPAAVEGCGPAARALLKLASLPGAVFVERIVVGEEGEPLRIRAALAGAREKTYEVTAADLDVGVEAACDHLLARLLDAQSFTAALEVFAARSAKLAALQVLTNHMLMAVDVDQALYVMLSGVTSGYGLGFNRAALFLYDESRDLFVGSKAIGPHDEQEAHRIWEEIEYADTSFDHLVLVDYANRNFDTRFEAFVKTMQLTTSNESEDEVRVARASLQPVHFRRDGARNPSLEKLHVGRELVLAAIRPHGNLRGLLFADNIYSGTPITPARVEFLHYFIDQVALVWENLSLLHTVDQLARKDSLTGVENRRGFDERFREAESRCRRNGLPCSLLAIDIDHFKETNDRLGHAGGDDVLRELGVLLRDGLREHDVAARLGGDEFVVLLPDIALAEAVAVAMRIGRAAKERGISLSIGCATWPGTEGSGVTLVRAADELLYKAKRAGRSRVASGDGVILMSS